MADDPKIEKNPNVEEALRRGQHLKMLPPHPLKAPRPFKVMLNDIEQRFRKTIDFLAKS
jgi:hypothetical protein